MANLNAVLQAQQKLEVNGTLWRLILGEAARSSVAHGVTSYSCYVSEELTLRHWGGSKDLEGERNKTERGLQGKWLWIINKAMVVAAFYRLGFSLSCPDCYVSLFSPSETPLQMKAGSQLAHFQVLSTMTLAGNDGTLCPMQCELRQTVFASACMFSVSQTQQVL